MYSIHWPIFEDGNRKSVVIGCVDLHKKVCRNEKFAQNGDEEQFLSKIHNTCHFDIGQISESGIHFVSKTVILKYKYDI